MRTWERTWHLIFLAHMWALSPFAFLWLVDPGVARGLPVENMAQMRNFTIGVIIYFTIRTALAFLDPKWLKWTYVFPPIDVLLITVMLSIGDKDPQGNVTILYFLPIAEAVGTLNVIYAVTIGVLSILGFLLGATNLTERPFNVVFRLVFIVVCASLFTFLARQAAEFRSRARVAAHRNRLAMEMHDGVQAQLIAAASQMELVQHLAPIEGKRAAAIAQESRGTLRQAADELRFLVQRLRAPAMGEGFVPALRQYAHNFCERFGLGLDFVVTGEPQAMIGEQENALFRIAQESLTNVVKHAAASSVSIELRFGQAEIVATIADDGRGMQRREGDNGSVGLESMAERAKNVGGCVSVKPREGGGTVVEATIPLVRRVKVNV